MQVFQEKGLKLERCPEWAEPTVQVWRSPTVEVLALFDPPNRLFNCLDVLLQQAYGPLFGAVPAYVTQTGEVQK